MKISNLSPGKLFKKLGKHFRRGQDIAGPEYGIDPQHDWTLVIVSNVILSLIFLGYAAAVLLSVGRSDPVDLQVPQTKGQITVQEELSRFAAEFEEKTLRFERTRVMLPTTGDPSGRATSTSPTPPKIEQAE